jgi:phosphoribosylanthranilate isomerase
MSPATYERGRRAPTPPGADADRRTHLPQGPVVKVCGLTRVQDVLAARLLGAWALGFIFAPSPRRLTPAEARRLLDQAQREIAAGQACMEGAAPGVAAVGPPASRQTGEGSGPLTVGVFVDSSPEDIAGVTRYVGLDAIQLHGPLAPSPGAVRAALGRWEPPLRLAIPVQTGAADAALPVAPVEPLIIVAVGVAVDEHDDSALRRRLQQAGGQEALVLVDASVEGRAGGTGQRVPWHLVGEAAGGTRFLLAGGVSPGNVREALAVSGAWGVDVSSGVESAPGVKDKEGLKKLMASVNELRRASSQGTAGTEEEGSIR